MFRRPPVGLVVFSIAFLVIGNAWGEAIYTITDLGGGEADGINASGQVVGQNAVDHAFLYSNGVMTDLGTFGGTSSAAYGINSSGQVVGLSLTASGSAQRFSTATER